MHIRGVTMIHGKMHSGMILSIKEGVVLMMEGYWVSITPGDGMPDRKIFLPKKNRGILIKGTSFLPVIKTFQDSVGKKEGSLVLIARKKEAEMHVGETICYCPGDPPSVALRWCVVPPSGGTNGKNHVAQVG